MTKVDDNYDDYDEAGRSSDEWQHHTIGRERRRRRRLGLRVTSYRITTITGARAVNTLTACPGADISI